MPVDGAYGYIVAYQPCHGAVWRMTGGPVMFVPSRAEASAREQKQRYVCHKVAVWRIGIPRFIPESKTLSDHWSF